MIEVSKKNIRYVRICIV